MASSKIGANQLEALLSKIKDGTKMQMLKRFSDFLNNLNRYQVTKLQCYCTRTDYQSGTELFDKSVSLF